MAVVMLVALVVVRLIAGGGSRTRRLGCGLARQ